MAKLRKPLIAANWKMNPVPEGVRSPQTVRDLTPYQSHAAVDVVVFPTLLDLAYCIKEGLIVGAQCGHPEASGAHTGDVGMTMLKAIGCHYVLCGHSERRRDHHESDAFVSQQAVAAIEAGLHPIVCIGETLEERETGKAKSIVERQLRALPLNNIESNQLSAISYQLVIAYEPIWAIGTGKTATAPQAQEMHAFIRGSLPKALQGKTRILYGGSVNGDNAYDLFAQEDIDGMLVGGASLKPPEFRLIVESVLELCK